MFLEDLAIAVVLARFAAAIGRTRAIVVVAVLFAAGHIPSILASGILAVLFRSRAIVWFWCPHFAMDGTQFEWVVGVS